MRCNLTYALFSGALMFAQTASGQQIPPAQQLKAPATPPGSSQAATSQASANAAPAGSANVLTLSQAASSPAPAPASASASASAPLNVPPIVENAELATGKNSRKLDAAGPRGVDNKAAVSAPEIVLLRVSYVDNVPRALMKIHGVARFVGIGSPVLKQVVASISDDGVCLNPLEQKESPKKDKKGAAKAGPSCAQMILFQSQG
ncbi:hypothetical protein GCM10027277_57970 [Pseudoduganella ginsengisoli]|uniref:Uncharacterized protein n=1 Tax=Pseudoduganella ginsengisoli TaxID=1462440 RepID=A0A6L6Q8G0_9BURK|nr:hypothetical protein [Pseudoduganella ginsengisoli]MTW05895.1 hypothetical protein [Pseudoduganella ginsengisoli]